MTLRFAPAEKQKAKLRLGIYGPSGAGKMLTALRLATGMDCGKIALIDTEQGSASLYADRYTFDVLNLPKADIETYTEAIRVASKAGYPILIIDSLTHAWQNLLERVDQIAKSRYRGNKWSAWSEATPMHRSLVTALLTYSGHVIATMRTKTEWATNKGDDGKVRPTRIGLAPEQGKGIEYEFSLLMEITPEHVITVTKDRTGEFQDQAIEKPGEELGALLMEWLNSGAEPKPEPEPEPQPKQDTQPMGGVAWVTDQRYLERFWAWATKDLGLNYQQTHEALKVEHLRDYQGTPDMAKTTILSWIDDQIDTAEAQRESEGVEQEAMPL